MATATTALARVTILHNVSPARFSESWEPGRGLEIAYRYRTERTALGDIWRDNNVVDGTEVPYQLKMRSLSVGDVIVIETPDRITAHTVDPIGFTEIDITPIGEDLVNPGQVLDAEPANECLGHESTDGPIGNTVYCDGTCRPATQEVT